MKRRLRILITAGPTREYFDTVRFISNGSTGKMGYALAATAARRGHNVTLVSGPTALKPPAGVAFVPVTTAAEMAAASKRSFVRADAAIFTAAVCDYRPAERVGRKLKKNDRSLIARLEPTEDISQALGRRKGRRVTIAFAMEDHNARRFAAEKLAKKNCDAIVLNGPANVGADDATVDILLADGAWTGTAHGTKRQIAARVVRLLETLHAERRPRTSPRRTKAKR